MRLLIIGLLVVSPAVFAAVDDTLLSVSPSTATVLTGIDVQKAAASGSGAQMLHQVLDDEDVARWASICHFNARREIRQLLLVEMTRRPGPDSPHVVLARAGVGNGSLIAGARSGGAVLRTMEGTPVLVYGKNALALPRPGVLMIGDLPSVTAALQHSHAPGGLDPLLREEVAAVAPANDVWYATILSGAFLGEEAGDALPAQLRNSDALQRISRSSGGLRFGDRDSFVIYLLEDTASDARSMLYVLRLAGGFAQLQLGGSPGFVLAENVLRSMRVTTSGATLELTSEIDDSQIANALAAGK